MSVILDEEDIKLWLAEPYVPEVLLAYPDVWMGDGADVAGNQ